ncbi:MAG: hypothetical protein P8Y54_11230 [Xanthomonadales bacterium]
MQGIGEGLQMTTYFPERMCCPRCDHGFSYMAVGSYNTFGATFTDGYIEGPMYDDQGRLFRCPHCHAVGWNDEFACEDPDDGDEAELGSVFDAEAGPIPLKDYPALLDAAPWRGPDEEKYVRIAAFWAANMPRRGAPESTEPFSASEERNLRALLERLDDSPQDRLMRAEILRETGQFEACLEVLAGFEDEDLETVARLIRTLAMGRDARVVAVPQG